MKESNFFTLPTEKKDFQNFVNNITADGGGDNGGENGLEALALAIKSDWTKFSDKQRHLIVIWTDEPGHPLEKAGKPKSYPKNIPPDFNGLTDWWNGQGSIGSSSKRLIMYAPDAYPWTNIGDFWKLTIHYASPAGKDMKEEEYNQILDAIAASIGQ